MHLNVIPRRAKDNVIPRRAKDDPFLASAVTFSCGDQYEKTRKKFMRKL